MKCALQFVYVIGLHAFQFGNNWMRKIVRTAKIGRARRPNPIWQSEKFFESNYFQIGQACSPVTYFNYIASKNRRTWQIYDSLKYRKFSKYADEFGHYQHKTKPCCNLIGRYLVHFMLTFDWFMESIQIFLIFNGLFKAKGNVPGKTTYPLYFKFGQLAKINKK